MGSSLGSDLILPGLPVIFTTRLIGSGPAGSLGPLQPSSLLALPTSSLNSQQILLPSFSINITSTRHLDSSGWRSGVAARRFKEQMNRILCSWINNAAVFGMCRLCLEHLHLSLAGEPGQDLQLDPAAGQTWPARTRNEPLLGKLVLSKKSCKSAYWANKPLIWECLALNRKQT